MTPQLTDAHLDALASVLRSSTGLVFPPPRRRLLRRAALAAMREVELTEPDDFVHLVGTDDRRRARLAALTTVGETYLFRHKEQLDELRRRVIEPLVAERAHQRRRMLRAWSAGCATGEETYTLAILIAEAIPDPERWDLRIIGTDLNPDALADARRATYGRWSMREPLAAHARWFEPTGAGLRVLPTIRRLVRFEQHNLLTLPLLPSALDGALDLVLCRNVLMYLDHEAISRVLGGLHDVLAPGGWLVVAPVEASIGRLGQRLEVYPTQAGALFRRPSADAERVRGSADATRPVAHKPTPQFAGAARHERRVAFALPDTHRPTPAVQLDALSGIANVRALADLGQLDEARERCVEVLARAPASIEGHVLLAAIAEAQDDLDGAAEALRRILYLDRRQPTAQFRLGLVEWRRGRIDASRARLRHALKLVEGKADAEPLDDGLTAGRIRTVVGAMLE